MNEKEESNNEANEKIMQIANNKGEHASGL